MRVTLRELRAIIQREIREDYFTRGMWTAPTSSGQEREQLRDLTQNPDDYDNHLSAHLEEPDEDMEEFFGPVPPRAPGYMDGASIGSDPYVRDWAAINSPGVSR
jgi:hypothetical protein